MITELIKKYIEQEKNNIINDCTSLISIPSVSSDKKELKKALDFVIKTAKNIGLNAYSVENDSIGIVDFGEGDETIGILAHIDVVPAGDEALWKHPPFKGTYEEGWICGRGAIDDKGPLIASLYAIKVLKELNVPIYKKIKMIIGTQEEVTWTDMDQYKQHYPLPDFGFTPDGEFPITTKEKGCVDVELTFDKCKCPGEFDVLSFSGGEALNAVPAYCEILLNGDINILDQRLTKFNKNNPHYAERIYIEKASDGIKVYSSGVSAHSSAPDKGINAINILASFLTTLALTDMGATNLVNFITSCKVNFMEDYIEEKEYQTTFVASMLSTANTGYSLYVNLRTSLTTISADIEQALDDMKKELNFNYAITSYLAPICVDEKIEFLQLMSKAYEDISGLKNHFCTAFGTTYAKAMPNTVCFGPMFPGEYDSCHEVNERISSDSIMSAACIYAYFLYLTATSKNPLNTKN